jgi:hypothetical protein
MKASYSATKMKKQGHQPYKFLIIDMTSTRIKRIHIFNKLIPSVKDAVKTAQYAKDLYIFVIHDCENEDLKELQEDCAS